MSASSSVSRDWRVEKKREDDDAVVGHEEADQEVVAETDDAHSRVMQ